MGRAGGAPSIAEAVAARVDAALCEIELDARCPLAARFSPGVDATLLNRIVEYRLAELG